VIKVEKATTSTEKPVVALLQPKEESELEEACGILRGIMDTLNKPRRITILNALPPGITNTFDQLKAKTGLSTGSLHHHLKELRMAGFIYKTNERPAEFGRTDFLEDLIALVESRGREKTEELAKIMPVQVFKMGNVPASVSGDGG